MESVKWSFDLIPVLTAKAQFLFLSGPPDHINISQAQRVWTVYPQVIFNRQHRLAGTPVQLVEVLSEQRLTNRQIDEILEHSISQANHRESEDYQKEWQHYEAWRRAMVKANKNSPGATLLNLIEAMNPQFVPLTARLTQRMIKKRESQASTKASKPTRAVSNRRAIDRSGQFYERILTLPEDKVLDVSKLTERGTGASSVNRPTGRSTKVGTANLPIISNNFETYLLAVSMIPDGRQRYHADLEYMSRHFGVPYEADEQDEQASDEDLNEDLEEVAEPNPQIIMQRPVDFEVQPIFTRPKEYTGEEEPAQLVAAEINLPD